MRGANAEAKVSDCKSSRVSLMPIYIAHVRRSSLIYLRAMVTLIVRCRFVHVAGHG